ncbi:MAG: CPBP family intramembrane glutamic endopeptidase [Undibacterium umbellatum]|uniref:CPBP family intramembrane glutamic endopeptidase n=1 Tax=Undibacterium umbellatum TaxID=2762300 RepID=UPI003BB5AB2D
MITVPELQILPYLFLYAAIAAAWLPNVTVAGPLKSLVPGHLLAIFAVLSALLSSLITPMAAAVLAALALLLWASVRNNLPLALRILAGVLALVVALILAMHKAPGFHNMLLLDKVRFSDDAIPFTLYANFDKGMAGYLMLSLFCSRASSFKQFLADGKRIALPALLTIVVLTGLGLATQFFRFHPKLPEATLLFLAVNLVLTCVAEEAFFRGLIQESIYRLGNKPVFGYLAIAVSAVLFGLAHLGGGTQYAALATVAGLGYAIVYHRTRRLEWVILTHAAFNLCHFILFTYPRLA